MSLPVRYIETVLSSSVTTASLSTVGASFIGLTVIETVVVSVNAPSETVYSKLAEPK